MQRLLLVLAVGVAVVVVLTAGALLANRLPWREPPGLAKRLNTYLTTNTAETRPDSLFPELRPEHYALPPERLYQALHDAVAALGWQVVEADPQARYVHAVAVTPLLRFRDDLRAWVTPQDHDKGSVLWVRSMSRVGRGDFGANTRHVLDLEKAVQRVVGNAAKTTPRP